MHPGHVDADMDPLLPGVKADDTAHIIPADAMASANPFGLLPDAVLLYILREQSDNRTQQAAYKSCKYLRDFCNRHMKSVTVEIQSSNSLQAVQRISSNTLCPRDAFGIKHLTVRIMHFFKGSSPEHAYAHLQRLIYNTSANSDGHMQCRRKELANISSIKLLMTGMDIETARHLLIITSLLDQFPNLRSMHTNVEKPLSCVWTPHLTHVVFSCHLTPEQLYDYAIRHTSLKKLEIVLKNGTELKPYERALQQLKNLEHLVLVGQALGIQKSEMVAGVLNDLTQLHTLALHNITITDGHLLTQLQITHLVLEDVQVNGSISEEHLQLPARWPALRSVQFIGGRVYPTAFSESLARTFLPMPHPGFSLIWPNRIHYVADVDPHLKFEYMGITHMTSFDELSVTGQHAKSAMREIINNGVTTKQFSMYERELQLTSGEVATHLALPTVVCMRLGRVVITKPELLREVFQKLPKVEKFTTAFGC